MAIVTKLTPEDYIIQHSNNLKLELEKYDIQVNKLGIIGYLLNILGNTNYDIKNYYDYLFKEGFVATSQEEHNLYMHSTIYGYNNNFAIPSTANGKLTFDFTFMPKKSQSVKKREIVYSNINFKAYDTNFYTDNIYRFIEEDDKYYCMIYFPDGKTQYVPSQSQVVEAPMIDFKQYEKEEIIFRLPNYQYGTYYSKKIDLEDANIYLSDIEVLVEEDTDNSYTKYDLRNIKYLEDAFSKIVFFKMLDSNKFIIEFGSGLRGVHLANKKIKIILYKSLGQKGNLNITNTLKNSNSLQNINQLSADEYYTKVKTDTVLCYAVNTGYDDNETKTYIPENVKDILTINFDYSSEGKDQQTGDDLRNSIVNHIQTRDNLMSERDFYNIYEKYNTDFKFLFKKTSFIDNNFYLCKVLRDKFQNPVYTLNHTQKLLSNHQIPPQILNTINTSYSSKLKANNYSYFLSLSDNFRESIISNILNINIQEDNKYYITISLTHPDITEAERIIVYRKDNTTNKLYYTEIINTNKNTSNTIFTFTDDNININWIETKEANIDSINKNKKSFKPRFIISQDINNINFISPFLYKYNEYFNYYEGYLIYDELIVNFANIEKVSYQDYTYDIPNFFFHIKYDTNFNKTYIYLKSHEDITDYIIRLTSTNLNIYNQELIQVDSNTYVFEYTEEMSNNDFGLLPKNTTLEVIINKKINLKNSETGVITTTEKQYVKGYTNIIQQTVNLADQLKLPIYSLTNTNLKYITNIPIIHQDTYNNNKEYYNDKINNFIFNDNILTENRMVTDSVQFRFLNTFNIESYYSYLSTVQKYNFTNNINLPLKIEIECILDTNYLTNNDVDLSTEKDNLILNLAEHLLSKYSGTNISYYDSQLIDYIHTDRPYIKSVNVITKDNQNNILNNLEILDDNSILNNIIKDIKNKELTSKLNILQYTPTYYYWDINNISLKFKK